MAFVTNTPATFVASLLFGDRCLCVCNKRHAPTAGLSSSTENLYLNPWWLTGNESGNLKGTRT